MRSLLPAAVLCLLLACSPPPPPVDPEADAGDTSSPVDAGTEVTDAGTAEVDAGIDAGAAEVDAGIAEVDAGTDAGTAELDAGVPDAGAPDAGCRCTASEFCAAGRCVTDTLPPRLTVTAGPGSSAGTLHLSGTASDGETALTPVELQINGTSAGTANVVAGVWDVQVPVTAGRAEYSVIATVRDGAGNTASAETAFDAEAPTIALNTTDGVCTSTGCTGAFIDAAATTFSLSATVTDGLPLASAQPVQVRVLDGATVLVAWTDLVRQSNGSWTWTWSALPQLDFTQLTLEVAATDAANNRGTANLTVLYDRVRPSLTFTPAQNAACTSTACTGTVVNAASTSLELVGLASPDTSLSLRVLDGAAVVLPAVDVPKTGSSWTWSWTSLPNVDGRFYSLEVTATDALRNTFTQQLVVLVDRVTPSLVVNSPRQGTLVGTAQVSVNASSSDGHGLMRVEAATLLTGPFTAATRDANGDYVVQLPVPAVDAVEQTLHLRATDLAGNVRTATTHYTADRVAPVLTLDGADFDCSGPNACSGSVANRGSTQVVYGGTFSDGSAVGLQKTLVGPTGATVVASTDPVTGASWSWTWGSLPQNVNGAAYQLRVIATDAAGNASAQLVRRTWLDNVAPTVTIPVSGQRRVQPLAIVSVYSEPMDAASVVASTVFSPAISMSTFGTTDGSRFQFTAAPAMQHYTPQTLTIGAGKDKAGNLSGSASATFLTAPAPLPNPFIADLAPSGQQHRAPRIVVDEDGRITLAYTRVNGSTASAHLYRDVGSGSGTRSPVFMNLGVHVPTDLKLTGSSRDGSGRLLVNFELAMILNDGAGTSLGVLPYASGWTTTETLTQQPLSIVGATQNVTTANLARVRPAIERVPTFSLVTGAEGFYRSTVAPNNGATAMLTWKEQPTWSSLSTATVLSTVTMNGNASTEFLPSLPGAPPSASYRVRFWDFGAMSEVTTGDNLRSVTGQPAFKRSTTRGPTPTSASYLAWTSETSLSVGCNGSPFSAPWLRSTLTHPQRLTGSPLASAMSPSTFVVAGEYGGAVYVYSTPVTNCAAAPVLTQEARIDGASEPGVTIDSAGKIWVVYVNAAGSVVVTKL